ncbi:BTAD domain-containing putative transcriptional regulator [Poseidonocella sp. HB161398]|uniref:AfsR/SARP family transcriptional regulator n=1 Tax=Poseidonocella sp. HB161398 TaxID=2320855 RepID=UPI001108FE12|nr:BTAD domain-containing putative transcriptional regulator [Poseidonocella sp. HB161398]
MSAFRLGVMGQPCLSRRNRDGLWSPVSLTRANRSLLSLLAVHCERSPLPRETVAEMLWPDCSEARSRSRLSSALWRLRKSIGPDAPVLETDGCIGLLRAPVLRVDLWCLRRAAGRVRTRPAETWTRRQIAALDLAMQFRSGPFLSEVDGEWTAAARQSCAELYETALECLMRFYRNRGDCHRSIDAARSLVRQDPYREDIHAALIELYAEAGQRARAISQYQHCCEILRTDLGVAPAGEIEASLTRALGRNAPAAIPADLAALVGEMDAALDRLHQQMRSLKSVLGALSN